MRWALFGPTPGSARSASIRPASAGECRIRWPNRSERQLQARRQLQPAHEAGHLRLRRHLNPAHRVVDRGTDQILEHLAIPADYRRFDLHALDLMAAIGGDLEHNAPTFTGHFESRQL